MGRVVLGVSSRAGGERLTVHTVIVSTRDDGRIEIEVRDGWRGTKGQDAGRELTDLHDALCNLLDGGPSGSPEAIAVKRVEPPPRGRPPATYDDRIRLEAAAMLAAIARNRRYFGYRRNELGRGGELCTKARDSASWPDGVEAQEAVDAACAALSDLLADAD